MLILLLHSQTEKFEFPLVLPPYFNERDECSSNKHVSPWSRSAAAGAAAAHMQVMNDFTARSHEFPPLMPPVRGGKKKKELPKKKKTLISAHDLLTEAENANSDNGSQMSDRVGGAWPE